MNAAALALAVALVAPPWTGPGQDPLERARALLFRGEPGDWSEAWEVLEEATPLNRARGRTELCSAGGDLPGTLRQARAGLALAPDTLDLRWHALSVESTLGDAAGVARDTRLLRESLAGADLEPGDREAWELALAEFEERARVLGASEAARRTALGRARWLSLAGLGGMLVALLALLRPQAQRTRRR